ncbi:hypothetical protein GDI2097 [Gluconacetobacter diazotrophicus PA1 5]|uniref:Uncharacterized protein n=1 Tax=Gluconacetobacter diazotrophicus (strain ATCC 49037 / DSM 5601 / CCUG 37298 / CIP 103539 / LMG 7603 / PAl5) TaxID=272568 RepID=A9HKH0_GLUDA|nr:hypothetical protein GDI2097 [Gluconacetobacter diazotrophicus PA1 5]
MKISAPTGSVLAGNQQPRLRPDHADHARGVPGRRQCVRRRGRAAVHRRGGAEGGAAGEADRQAECRPLLCRAVWRPFHRQRPDR